MKTFKSLMLLAMILGSGAYAHPALAAQSNRAFGCLGEVSTTEAVLVAGPKGRILYQRNQERECIPASTLKLLTALTAIHRLGLAYRFKTEFYLDADRNLEVKGYGDPYLISEILQEIADALARRISQVKDLVVDDTYFSNPIIIPGRDRSTNPYDAPVGAFCANFNTVAFHRDRQGRIVSSEPQTPMLPFVREKIRRFPLSGGRCTFSHDRRDTALYAGGLLRYFLERRGVGVSGVVRPGFIRPADRLILTYQSRRTLQEVLKEMLEYSSNFTANQILVAMGARVYGPPGTLAKGVRVVSDYARKQLQLKHLKMVEGSGISRENRISALDMLAVLNGFRPYRHLLRRDGPLIYKTGTLKGIRARSGYMDGADGGLYEFAIFLNQSGGKVHDLLECLKRSIGPPDFTPPG